MAADHDDDRARQLKALRRHMVHPDTRWEPPTGVGLWGDHATAAAPGPRRRRRPPLSWLLVTGLLVAVALVGGVFVGAAAGSDDRPARANTGVAGAAAATSGPDAATVTPTATLQCKTAVDRANAMLASAVRLRGALAEQDKVLNDPANRDLTVGEVLGKLAVSEQAGSSESARFDRALDEYLKVVDQCDLRAP
jgi:hypothetical protein